MRTRKLIAILLIFMLISIAHQFHAFGKFSVLTGKLFNAVKLTATKVSKILVKEKEAKEVVLEQPANQTVVSKSQIEHSHSLTSDNAIRSMRKEKLENSDWEYEVETFPYMFSEDISDEFQELKDYDADIETPDDLESFLYSLTIEIFPLSTDEFSDEDLGVTDEEMELLLPLETSWLEFLLDTDKQTSEETNDSLFDPPELMDEPDNW